MRRALRTLLYGGVAVAVLGFSKVHAVVYGYDFTGSSRFAWALSYIGILVVAAYGLGFPELRRTRRSAYLGAVQVALVGAGAMSAIQMITGDALLPRFVVLGSALALVPWLVVCARLADGHATGADQGDRVLMIAHAADRARVTEELAAAPERRAELVVALEPEAASTVAGGLPVLDQARASRATVVVLCRDAQSDESVVAQVSLLHETGVKVRTIPAFFEEWFGKVPMSELERTSLLFDVGEVHDGRYGPVKRLFDLALAVPGLLLLVVLVPLVMLANRMGGNAGRLFFSQDRVGKQGTVFRILKFRTMRPGDGDDGRWTADDDPRITRVGRLLRTTHLDELPQVVNIVRGELSVVGPRPEQPSYVEELSRKLPFYDLRHMVRPGLTGWAQVKYGYAGDERDALEKLQYEFFYLRHQNVRFDARIVGRTVRSVLGRAGR